MEGLRKLALKDASGEIQPKLGEEVIAIIQYIDGTILDRVLKVDG
jgi:hypothetical protein